jgi:hypothetical protein
MLRARYAVSLDTRVSLDSRVVASTRGPCANARGPLLFVLLCCRLELAFANWPHVEIAEKTTGCVLDAPGFSRLDLCVWCPLWHQFISLACALASRFNSGGPTIFHEAIARHQSLCAKRTGECFLGRWNSERLGLICPTLFNLNVFMPTFP